MQVTFYKYHGTGNDFIIIDNMKESTVLSSQQIAFLCHRRFGIGADGLMIIAPDSTTDFLMQYYNADGNLGSMCGNGGRCIVGFAANRKYIKGETKFNAVDGEHNAMVVDSINQIVRLQMADVVVPKLSNNDLVLDTGSPHFVRFVESVDKINVVEEGRAIRYNDFYKKNGINVNFVEQQNDILYIRTYERGVEDETLSCGTGVTASVLAAAFTKRISENGKQKVKTPGGLLSVQYERDGEGFRNVWLEGPATFVYEGQITIL